MSPVARIRFAAGATSDDYKEFIDRAIDDRRLHLSFIVDRPTKSVVVSSFQPLSPADREALESYSRSNPLVEGIELIAWSEPGTTMLR